MSFKPVLPALPRMDDAGFTVEADATWFDEGSWEECDIPPRAWIAPGYFLRGAVTLIVGPGGVSKSTLAVTYAVALASRREFQNMRPVSAMRVMLFNVEDDSAEQKRRLSGALTSFGREPAHVAGWIARVGPSKTGTLLTRDPDSGALQPSSVWIELERHIEHFRPDVVFLDPLAELHGDDENANVQLREVVAEFRALAVRYSLALVLIHHTRKGVVTPGDMDAGRGASAIASAARVVLTVSGMTADEAGKLGIHGDDRHHYFRVDGGKSNYHALTGCEWFERVPFELANRDTVAIPRPWNPPKDVVTAETREAIALAVAKGSETGPWSAKLSHDARSIKQLFVMHGIATADGQRAELDALTAAGFRMAAFRSASRSRAQGLRSPDGQPETAAWIEDVEP